MNKTIKCFLGCCVVLVICFYTIIVVLNKPTKKVINFNIPRIYTEYYEYGTKVNDVKNLCDTIIKYEGISCTPYVWNNVYYVGIGHQIHNNEKILLNGIDTLIATIILYNDLDEALYEGFELTHLTGNRLLCIADFLFGYGSPTFIKSGLYKQILINPDDTLKIKAELSKWNKINGRVNPKLVQRRNYDYWLYTH